MTVVRCKLSMCRKRFPINHGVQNDKGELFCSDTCKTKHRNLPVEFEPLPLRRPNSLSSQVFDVRINFLGR